MCPCIIYRLEDAERLHCTESIEFNRLDLGSFRGFFTVLGGGIGNVPIRNEKYLLNFERIVIPAFLFSI